MSTDVGVILLKRGPIYVEWHIEDYFSYTGNDTYLNSPSFFFDDTEWWLQFYPSGEDENSDYISFFLVKKESKEKIDIDFTLGMMKTNGSVFHTEEFIHSFEESDDCYGTSRFFLTSELLNSKDTIASDDVLRAFCIIRFVDIAVTDTACETDSSRDLDVLTQNLKDLYLNGRLCDVTITVKDQDFQVHKSILAARSPVFSAMFEHDMVEKKSSAVNIIDCDPNSFKDFLLFLYTGKLENVLPSDVFGLYETANKYDVKELKEECVQLMKHNLSVETFSDTVLLAAKFNESELQKSATEFFFENVEIILPTTKWQLFMAENSCIANDLFMKFVKRKKVVAKK